CFLWIWCTRDSLRRLLQPAPCHPTTSSGDSFVHRTFSCWPVVLDNRRSKPSALPPRRLIQCPSNTLSGATVKKLRSILPEDDHCVLVSDPLEVVLDRLMAGDCTDPTFNIPLIGSRYFGRLKAGPKNPPTCSISRGHLVLTLRIPAFGVSFSASRCGLAGS